MLKSAIMAEKETKPAAAKSFGEAKKSDAALREEAVLQFWRKNKIFEKSLEQTEGKKEFVFFEGPPTANGKPGIHHLEARAFKDAIPRYKTMRGFHVRRKGGWDTHGLPVELQVEKKLGLNSKKAIEEYGIAKFNQECKESVWEYLDTWNKFTKRIGFWLDQDNPYVTYENNYIESVWNIVKEINKQKLLYKDYKVVPWCPRCGTALSSHELAQGYEDVKDLSVYVKFKVKPNQKFGAHMGSIPDNTYILAWTTTPWTLPGNVALAVGEDIEYAMWKENESYYIFAMDLGLKLFPNFDSSDMSKYFGPYNGNQLIGLEYEPLFPFLAETISESEKPKLDKAYKVYEADFVNTEDGTGIVHTAVMYGQDDFELGTAVGLPKHHLVNPEGKFIKGTGFLEGRFVKEKDDKGKPTLDVDIIKYLTDKNLFFSKENYQHSYPHCWRCKTALIYYARDSWYIRMSDPKIKKQLISENKKINWEPEYIKEGRFGEWLKEIKDWAISRERYWGTPLPVWQCAECKQFEVIGSIEELKEKTKNKLPLNDKKELDLHRPYIDEIKLVCTHSTNSGQVCGGELVRVKEVMDVWFDSGAMPFAQDHYPVGVKKIAYPADFICEAIDQTRGWFYTLHAIGILMGRGKAYKNVICLGHLMDAVGKKMSKSIGNVVDPWVMMEKYGADTLRLWMYSVNQPGESKNFDEKTIALLQQQTFGLLYNVLAFYELYPAPEQARYGAGRNKPKSNNVLDVWILARLDELTKLSTENLDNYKLLEPVRAVRDFIGDLSVWYLRRSRERIKSGDEDARQTLYFVLKTLAKLLAPFAPFTAEDIWLKLKMNPPTGGDVESVHLTGWPKAGKIHSGILENMRITRTIVSLGLEARQKAKIQVRQTLAKLEVKNLNLSKEYIELIKDELNVKKVEENKNLEFDVKLDAKITPELKAEGDYREFMRSIQDRRKELGLSPGDKMALPVETIYKMYKIMPNLQEHMLRVAAVASMICDNLEESLPKEEIVTLCLLHDMGNIIKSNFEFMPENLEPQGLVYWQNVKNDFIKKYGPDEEKANMEIMKEIGVSDKILALQKENFFKFACKHRDSPIDIKIICYADWRVSPFGIVSFDVRMAEAKKRYTLKTKTEEDEREVLIKCCKEIEKQIFAKCKIKPEDINDKTAADIISELRNFVIK